MPRPRTGGGESWNALNSLSLVIETDCAAALEADTASTASTASTAKLTGAIVALRGEFLIWQVQFRKLKLSSLCGRSPFFSWRLLHTASEGSRVRAHLCVRG